MVVCIVHSWTVNVLCTLLGISFHIDQRSESVQCVYVPAAAQDNRRRSSGGTAVQYTAVLFDIILCACATLCFILAAYALY